MSKRKKPKKPDRSGPKPPAPDVWEDPMTKRWVKHVIDDMVPKMEGSQVVASIIPGGQSPEGDVKFWVETGAAIMMDKPIIAVAFDGRQIPPKLRLIADEIVVCPEGVGPEASEAVAQAVARVVKKLHDGNGSNA